MALSIYSPPLDTNTTGEIKGYSSAFPDHIEWFGCRHEIDAPFDSRTGLSQGHIQHAPVIAVKRLDAASPLLRDCLAKRGTVARVEFLFYRPDASGAEEHYFTITLEEAAITHIQLEQLNNRYPDNMPHDPYEHVAFTYDKIIWEAVQPGLMSFQSWTARRRRGG